jgi:hypothetical protein
VTISYILVHTWHATANGWPRADSYFSRVECVVNQISRNGFRKCLQMHASCLTSVPRWMLLNRQKISNKREFQRRIRIRYPLLYSPKQLGGIHIDRPDSLDGLRIYVHEKLSRTSQQYAMCTLTEEIPCRGSKVRWVLICMYTPRGGMDDFKRAWIVSVKLKPVSEGIHHNQQPTSVQMPWRARTQANPVIGPSWGQ